MTENEQRWQDTDRQTVNIRGRKRPIDDATRREIDNRRDQDVTGDGSSGNDSDDLAAADRKHGGDL